MELGLKSSSSWKTSENSFIKDLCVISINLESSIPLKIDAPYWLDDENFPRIPLILPVFRSLKPHGTICWKGVRSVVTFSAKPWYTIHWDPPVPMAATFSSPVPRQIESWLINCYLIPVFYVFWYSISRLFTLTYKQINIHSCIIHIYRNM